MMRGAPASPGTAVGPVARLAPAPALPADRPAPGPDEHAAALAALEAVVAELEARAAGLPVELREIMDTQVMMARDPSLAAGIAAGVRRGLPAAWAVHEAFGVHLTALAAIGGYLGERAADLADLRDRTVAELLGLPRPGPPPGDAPYVLAAVDLAPADTVVLDPARVLAIVTEKGGQTSHTAIVARALGIPAVVACPQARTLADGVRVIVDGSAGTVSVDPSEEVVTRARAVAEERTRELAGHTGPGRTSDGHPVALLLNIGGGDPGGSVDAEGVGLFRTEFLFLDRTTPPSMAEQRAAYGTVFAAFPGRPVIVRTLDAGADKPLPFATVAEPNPALGIRGYRTIRRDPALLHTQLDAIAAAAADHDADVRVMAPMITTPAEAAAFAASARAAGIASVGVMIEVPAAALRAREVLAEVDFASIGTNDLSQYTFAADRLLGDLADLLDPHQPALLTLIRLITEAAHPLATPIGLCGEAAADPTLAPILTGLGITSLSMSAPAIPAVRATLRTHTHAECVALAAQALR